MIILLYTLAMIILHSNNDNPNIILKPDPDQNPEENADPVPALCKVL
jgi:hypothetical protein